MNITVESKPVVCRVPLARTFLALAASLAIHAHAQEAPMPGEPGAQWSAPSPEDSPPPAQRRYSSNAKTNDRLNAVFTLIQTEGNGRTWERRTAEIAEDPTRVARVATKGDKAKSTTASNVAGKEAAAPVPATPPAPKPEPMPVLTWAFRPNATAQQTISEWAKSAGWKEPVWKATNAFQGQGELTGTFIDALRALAAAAPQLDIYASVDKREIIVSDATTTR